MAEDRRARLVPFGIKSYEELDGVVDHAESAQVGTGIESKAFDG